MITISQCKYANQGGTLIDMIVQFDRADELAPKFGVAPFPFTYSASDVRSAVAQRVGDELTNRPPAIAPYAPPPPDTSTEAQRADRWFNAQATRLGMTPAAFVAQIKRILA